MRLGLAVAAVVALVASLSACAWVLGIDDYVDAPPGGGGAHTATGSEGGSGAGSSTSTATGGSGAGGLGGQYGWSALFSTDGNAEAKDVAVSRAIGRIVVAGNFTGQIDFGGDPIASEEPGLRDGYVAVLDREGNHQWTRRLGHVNEDSVEAVAVDVTSAVWIVGSFVDEFAVHLPSGAADHWDATPNSGDIFVVKLDSAGDYRWGRVYGESSWPQGALGVGLDADGNGYVTGTIEGTVTFGGVAHETQSQDLFMLEFDSAGTLQRDSKMGHWGDQQGRDVAVDSDGNVIVVGGFSGEITSGNSATGGFDAFAAMCLDSCYDRRFADKYGDSEDQHARAVEVDGTDIIVAGEFRGNIDFGGGVLTSTGSSDAFVAKLDTNGDHIWSRGFGGPGVDVAYDVAVTAAGHVVVTGEIHETVTFDGCELTATDADVFVLELDGAGNTVWCERFGGVDDQKGRGVATDGDGSIVIHGDVRGSIDFGGGPLTATAGTQDVFVVRFQR